MKMKTLVFWVTMLLISWFCQPDGHIVSLLRVDNIFLNKLCLFYYLCSVYWFGMLEA